MRRGSHPVLPRAQKDPWALLKQTAKERSFRKKEFIYLAGDRAGDLYLLDQGRVRLFKHSPQGRNLTLSIVEPGDLFGEMGLFAGGRHESHAQALSDGFLYAIPRRHLQFFLEQDPSLAVLVMENLGQRLETVERRLGDLVFKSVPQRLAALLLDLAGPTALSGSGPARLPHHYTHQQLADMINTHRETVTKVVNRFRDDQLVDVDRREIVLLDMERLREMARR